MEPILRRLLALLGSLVLALTSLVVLASGLNQAEVSLTRITFAPDSRRSELPSISCDGTRIVFVSNSDFHNEGLGSNKYIWLYDTPTAALTRLTRRINALDFSDEPSINANGTRIAFYSDNDFLNQGIPDGKHEIWLATLNPVTVTRLTSSTNFFGILNWQPDISADGSKVAFAGNYDFQSRVPLGHFEIWLVDTASKQVSRVTHAVPNNRSSFEPKLNLNGTRVVFRSNADFFNQGIPASSSTQIWLYDGASTTLTRITNASFPPVAGQNFLFPSISADGTRIVFTGNGDLLNQGLNRLSLWLYDTTTMSYTRVTSSNFHIHSPQISLDGLTIGFASETDPVSGQLLSAREIWWYDIASTTFTRVTSSTATGNPTNINTAPSLNGDGTIVVFQGNVDFSRQVSLSDYEIWRAHITPTLSGSPPLPSTTKIFLPLAMGGLGSSVPIIWEDDNFDGLIPGELAGQNGWVRAAPDRASAIVSPSPSTGNLLHIDAGPNETIVMNKDVFDQGDGQQTLSVRVLVQANQSNYPGCNFADPLAGLDSLAKIEVRTVPSGGYNKKFQLYFGSRSMRINYGPSQYDAVTIVPRTQLGHWYSIQVNFDLNKGLANVWVDGELAARDVPVHPGPIVGLGLSGWDLPGYVQLDELLGRRN